MGRLSDKVAIITGAADGQGAEEARLFAKEGAKVVATDIQSEKVESVVKEIKENGGEAISLKHDVANEDGWKDVVNKAVENFGKVDVLVNNAGITGDLAAGAADTDTEEWDKVIDVDLKGVFLGMKYVIPEMQKVGKGSIINISSIAGLIGNGGPHAYTAAKGGVRLMSKNAAVDYGKEQIRVNTIHPGHIKTPMTKDFLGTEDLLKGQLARIPLDWVADPIDIANGALYLASDESRFVTGTELVIDGGLTAKS
jgi:NAD(P)-dependent dehydrogenase (short-subunit alcohol dehydrogenase family)